MVNRVALEEWGDPVNPELDEPAVAVIERVKEGGEILEVRESNRNGRRPREAAATVEPTTHATVESFPVRELSQRKWLREWGLAKEGIGRETGDMRVPSGY